ncbi:MAG: hypothetical protein GY759_06060 [Chloroflexi bacterium]|nr:hypothetical protein [Chloroflexota bacterium]
MNAQRTLLVSLLVSLFLLAGSDSIADIIADSIASTGHDAPYLTLPEDSHSLFLPFINYGYPSSHIISVQVPFDEYPDGTPITADTILSGDEFKAKGILLAGAPQGDYCSDATAAAILVPPHHVGFIDDTFLTSSFPVEPPGCHAVAVEIRFIEPVREVKLVFYGSSSIYTLTAYDATDTVVGAAHQESVVGEGTVDIQYVSDLSNIHRITFGREASITAVKELHYKKDTSLTIDLETPIDYATYKLALALYVGVVLNEPVDPVLLQTLLDKQFAGGDYRGGFVTLYTSAGPVNDSNTEATAYAVLALSAVDQCLRSGACDLR